MTGLALIGETDAPHGPAVVNRAWLQGLQAAGYETDPEGIPELLLHHDFTEHFSTCSAGTATRRVAVRTWDFGPFPRSWADRIGRDFDRLWVYTDWIRQKAVEGGVDPDLVAVAPLGFDPSVFAPRAPATGPGSTFNFLFVGATVARKGVDILLRAYAQAFTPDEPVCLILKGHSCNTFYRGQHMHEVIAEFEHDPATPALRHLDTHLTEGQLGDLYRAADVGVFPYRAEGFAIPILEAMACGLPCVVPRFGACLDYCAEDTVYFVEARRIRLPVRREFTFNSLGFRERVERVDFCEVPVDILAAALREVYEASEEERRACGDAAAHAALSGWTWEHSVARILELLSDL